MLIRVAGQPLFSIAFARAIVSDARLRIKIGSAPAKQASSAATSCGTADNSTRSTGKGGSVSNRSQIFLAATDGDPIGTVLKARDQRSRGGNGRPHL